jgi:hypothetical protein
MRPKFAGFDEEHEVLKERTDWLSRQEGLEKDLLFAVP